MATALSYTGDGVVNVEAVATLPGHRGRGIGAAVTWAATLADPELPAVLLASDDGIGVYRRMGYLSMTRWTMWSGSRGTAVDQCASHHAGRSQGAIRCCRR